MKIHLLDPHVVKKLRSDLSFISVSHCVEELVWNSIDAGSTCIAVRLNLPFYRIQVIDNGNGISPDQMPLVGKRYATSKCHSLEDLESLQYGGFRGEALASLKDIASNLMIESRATGCEETYCKIFDHGKAGTPTISINPRPSKGTTVTVFDFMYNRPVRKNTISEAIDVEETCKLLQSIALIHPVISFSLLNEATGEMCLQFKKCSTPYFAFLQLFGKVKAKNLKPCDYREDKHKISGYISTDCFPSKNYQFLYVNKRLTLKTRLHKVINNVLNKALGGKNKSECSTSIQPSPQMLSPSRSQYCCFILNLSCPRNLYDTIFDRKRTMVEFSDWDTVTKFVQDAVVNFLSAEGLFPNLPVDTDNLLLEEGDTENPNSRFLNLGVDNFRNGLFSNPAKRLLTAGEIPKISNEVSSSEKCTPSFSPHNKISSENTTFSFNEQSSFNIEAHCNRIETVTHLKENSLKRNFICLKDTSTSVLENLKKTSNELKLSNAKTDKLSSVAFSTSALESDCDIPCSSVFPVQNPIMLTVPMKSTLSLLKKEGKTSDALKKLKEKYLFMPKKSKLVFGQSEKLVTSSLKINLKFHSNQESVINTNQPYILHNEVQKNSANEIASPINHKISVAAIDKNNCRITSKYAFQEETSLSPLKRLRRAENLKCKAQMLSVNESLRNKSKCVLNDVEKTDPVMDTKVEDSARSESSHFKKEKVKTSCLQNLQTFHGKVISNMTMKKKSFVDFKLQKHSENNPVVSLPQFDNSNPFLKTFSNSMETNSHSYDSEEIQKSSESTCFANEEIVYNYENNDSPLEKFQHSNGSAISPPSMFLKDKILPEVIANTSLSGILTTKQFLQDSETLNINNNTAIEKSCDINLESNLKDSDAFTDFTALSPNVSEGYDILNSTSSGDLDLLQEKTSIIRKDLLFNTRQNVAKSSSAISYDEIHQNSEILKNTPLNLDPLVVSIWSGSSSTSKNSSTVVDDNVNIDEKSPTSMSNQMDSLKHSPSASSESLSSPSEFRVSGEEGVSSTEINIPKPRSLSPRTSKSMYQDVMNSSDIDTDENELNFSTEAQNMLNEQLMSPTKFLNKTKLNKKNCLPFADCPFNLISNFQSIGEELQSEHRTKEFANDPKNLSNASLVSNFQCAAKEFSLELENEDHVKVSNDPDNFVPDDPNTNCSPCETEKSLLKNNLERVEEEPESCGTIQGKPDGNRWIRKVNENTKQIAYIDLVTGNSTHFPPASPLVEMKRNSIDKDLVSGHQKKAHFFLTHDFSPFLSEFPSSKELPDATDEICDMQIDLDNHIELVESNDWHRKWRYPVKKVETRDNSGNIQSMFQEWQNPMFENPPEINGLAEPQTSTCVPHMYFLNSYRFTQNCFNNLKVIGQVDCKFIACIMEDFSNNSKNEKLLVLFDQHAVHERVRLEELTEDLYEMKENRKVVKTVPISPSLDVTLESDEMRLLQFYRLSLQDIGLEVSLPNEGNTVSVSSLPSCLVDEAKNQPRKRISEAGTLVEKIIKEWLTFIMQTRSTSSVLPKTLNAVLNSQACRGAVKFGDPLDLSQCKLLITALSTCKLPFQCAHGRPSIAPILDLNKINSLNKKRTAPNLRKLHGVLENH